MITQNDLFVIKDKAKRLQVIKELKLNQLIDETIRVNARKSKRTKQKMEKVNELLKQNSLFENLVTPLNKHLLNKMPYLLFGVAESIFVNEEENKKTKEYGCAILIDKSVILLPAKNLIYYAEGEGEEDNENNNFKLFEIEFKPLNISPEYRSLFPKAIKVIDHYTPMREDNEKKDDEERIISSWGIAFLEYPIGDIINYIYGWKINKPIQTKGKQKYNPDLVAELQMKTLTNEELEQSEINFLECFPNERNKNNTEEGFENTKISTEEEEEEEDEGTSTAYDFYEGYYNMNFDSKLIYLNNPDQDSKTEEEVLPGFLIGKYMRKYYVLGMNTNTIVKFASEENQGDNSKNSNAMNTIEGSPVYHLAIRFTKELIDEIQMKIREFTEHYPSTIQFNAKIFDAISRRITNKQKLLSLLKNDCKNFYSLINDIKANENLTREESSLLDIENQANLKFISFSLSLLWNKFTSSIIECKIIDIENIRCGFFPGSDIISEIIQSKESLMTLNLKNNDLFSSGIKNIMLPIFNKKKLLDIGKELRCLCLDSNKLDGKSLKYIRYLIKVSPKLALISASNNYITGSSLRHLISATKIISSTKSKKCLEILFLNNNLLGASCGENLSSIILNLPNLKELNLSCNTLTDTPIPKLLEALKKNGKIDSLFLSNNEITAKSAGDFANFLSNNKSLRILCLNNNPLEPEGISTISQSLSTKIILEEINLSSTRMGDAGGRELFENLKMNRSIKRLYVSCNGLEKEAMTKFGEMMKLDNENENEERGGLEMIELSVNSINDECVEVFAQELMNYRWIKELKINSNFITDEGVKKLLYAVLNNRSIAKVNLENNLIREEFEKKSFKDFRNDIQFFF